MASVSDSAIVFINPKDEMSKFETIPNDKMVKGESISLAERRFEHCHFRIRACFGFRYSNFEFCSVRPLLCDCFSEQFGHVFWPHVR